MGIDFDEIERRHAADRRQREIAQSTPAPAAPAARPALGEGPVSTALGYALLIGLAALVVWGVISLLTGGRDESSYSAAIKEELALFADKITAVTAQSETTAVIETTLSSYEQLDLGPAMGMCAYLEIATNPALEGLAAVRVESRSGDVLYSCIVDL